MEVKHLSVTGGNADEGGSPDCSYRYSANSWLTSLAAQLSTYRSGMNGLGGLFGTRAWKQRHLGTNEHTLHQSGI